MMKRGLSLLTALFFSLSGETLYVSPDGSDRNTGRSVDAPFRTVRKALVAARSGDTVLLRGGIYREQVTASWRTKNEKPLTIKAFPDETPVISYGWEVENWKKLPDGLLSAPFPYAVCDLWEPLALDRYLKTDSMEFLRKQPGSFFQDPATGALCVNPMNTAGGAAAAFIAVPYSDGGNPLPFHTRKPLVPRSGMVLFGNNIHVEGLHFAFHGRSGFSLRGGGKELPGSGSLRNCTAVGTTCGFRLPGGVEGFVIENCRAIRNCGAGIHLGNFLKNIKIRNNFLLDNGNCPPFYGNYTDTSGNVYNLARYGGPEVEFIDFIGNRVISLDRSRQGGVMRCKGGIGGHTDVLNNVLVGGPVVMYAVPGSTARMNANTLVPGRFHFTVSNTGEAYSPEVKDNISSTGNDWEKKARFVNAAKYDFRLLPDSPYRGKGAFPGRAPVWFVKPGSAPGGSGRTPESPLNSLARLQRVLKSGDTVYFMPGEYTGALTLEQLHEVTLADMTFAAAVWRRVAFRAEKCRNLRIENMDFRDCRFTFSDSSVELKEARFSGSTFAAGGGKTLFANCRLGDTTVGSTGRIIFRENLLDRVKVAGKEVVSEHNGFENEEQLRAWPYKESFPSFFAGAKPGAGRAKMLLFGTAGSRIGGPVVKEPLPPLEVSELKVRSLDSGTKAVVSWCTPRDYVSAKVAAYQKGKRVFSGAAAFGLYLGVRGELCIENLVPGTPCRVETTLLRHNETKAWRKTLHFTPEKLPPAAPRLLKTGPGERFGSVAAALSAARSGDTVLIAPGRYAEMLDVRVDGLTVRAAKPGTVELSGGYMFDYILRAENVKGLTIDGIDFTGLRYSSSSKALAVTGSSGIRVVNCRFTPGRRRMGNCQFYGNQLKDVEISNCIFDLGFYAVNILKADKVRIDHNTFWGIGINAVHVAGGPGAEISITNNLCQDVVSNHANAAISVGHPGAKLTCDWNLYWNTEKKCPKQKIFGIGGVIGIYSTGQVLRKDALVSLKEVRERYGVEKHGLHADPKMKDPAGGDFALASDSPARGRGSDGRDIGADLSLWNESGR